MTLLDFLFGNENRASKTSYNVWSNSNLTSNRSISEENAMRVSAFNGCVRVLSETLGTLPLILYKKTSEGKERATDHPLYKILHLKTNSFQTPYFWKEMMMGHLQFRGAAYSQIVRDNGARVVEIVPLHPDRVELFWGPKNKIYAKYTVEGGKDRVLRDDQLLYVPGLSISPLDPFKPLYLMGTSIDSAIAMDESTSQYFSKSTRPSGILKHPTRLKKEKVQSLRDEFDKANSGTANAFGTILLEEGLEWQQMGLTNEQSQFIQTRKFSVVDICRFFRVPPHMVAELERATFSNIEQQSLEFMKYTMSSWITRFEEAMTVKLLSELEQKEYLIEFLVDGMLRGDVETRNKAYTAGVLGGWLSRNEVREMENRNRVEGLDEYLAPLNMGGNDGKEEIKSMEPVVKDAVGRILRKEQKMASKTGKKDILVEDHARWTKNILKSIVKDENTLNSFIDEFMKRSAGRLLEDDISWEDQEELELQNILKVVSDEKRTKIH